MSKTNLAPVVMVQGTASSVGKSLMVAALCRIFARRGLRVAPFKAQNMSLNASVVASGGEIGCAQMLQARACGIEADVRMNPVLLKPESDGRAQRIVLGRPYGHSDAAVADVDIEYLRQTVLNSLASLREEYDLVVIEGAGSPAEINLQDRDIVNMFVARAVQAPVMLVADIDRGGVFASLLGTLMLLSEEERGLIQGLVINKFRGRRHLLESGIDELESRAKKPVLGVVPMLLDFRLPDEDSVILDELTDQLRDDSQQQLDIVIVRYPQISNCDEFDMLEQEPGIRLRFVTQPDAIANADMVILPGSKSTVASLMWLRSRRLDEAILARAKDHKPIFGICGGAQILGQKLLDPWNVESTHETVDGLGLAPLETHFEREKQTRRTEVYTRWPLGDEVRALGYEIHAGRLCRIDENACAFSRVASVANRGSEDQEVLDGFISDDEKLVVTMQHGLFEGDAFRRVFCAYLWQQRGQLEPEFSRRSSGLHERLERLADHVQAHVDLAWIDELLADVKRDLA